MCSKIKIYYFLFTKESIVFCIDKFFLQTNAVHLEKMYVLLNMFRVEVNLAPQIAFTGTMKYRYQS